LLEPSKFAFLAQLFEVRILDNEVRGEHAEIVR
jgi:hypothetical protein